MTSKAIIDNCAEDIRQWMTANKLKLNSDKTKLIVFQKRNSEPLVDEINVGTRTIQNFQAMRDLGVYLNEHLAMNDHIVKL